jgi:hypothetical protein
MRFILRDCREVKTVPVFAMDQVGCPKCGHIGWYWPRDFAYSLHTDGQEPYYRWAQG